MLSRDSFEFSEVNIEDVCAVCHYFEEQFPKFTPEDIEKIDDCNDLMNMSVGLVSEDMDIVVFLDKCDGELCLDLAAIQFDNTATCTDNYIFDIFIPFDPEADFLPQIYRLFTENDIMVY